MSFLQGAHPATRLLEMSSPPGVRVFVGLGLTVAHTVTFALVSHGAGCCIRCAFPPPVVADDDTASISNDDEEEEAEGTPISVYLATLERPPARKEEEEGNPETLNEEHFALDIEEALGVLEDSHAAFTKATARDRLNTKENHSTVEEEELLGSREYDQQQHTLSRRQLKTLLLEDILFKVRSFLSRVEATRNTQKNIPTFSSPSCVVVTFNTTDSEEMLEHIAPEVPHDKYQCLSIGLQEVMTPEHHEQVRCLRRRLQRVRWRNAAAIIPWLCSNVPRRILVLAMGISCSWFLAKLGGQNYQLGRELEPAVKQLAQSWFGGGSSTSSSGEDSLAVIKRTLPTLLLKEVLKFTVAQVGRTTVEQCIRRQTAGRREKMSENLTMALCKTKMDFYLTHTEEEVERILRYPNDLEGVDIRIQFAVHHTLQSFGRLYATYVALGQNWRPLVALIASVFITNSISRAARRLQLRWEAARKRSKGFRRDAVEKETDASGTGVAFMSQLAILEHIKELKPHRAEVALAEEWYGMANVKGSTTATPPMSFPRKCFNAVRTEVKLFVRDFGLSLENSPIYAAKATVTLSDTLLPTAFAAAIVGMHSTESESTTESATTGVALSVVMEAYRSCKDCVSDVQALHCVGEVVMDQGHMARTLRVLLHDKSSWEEEDEATQRGQDATVKDQGNQQKMAACPGTVSIRFSNVSYAYPTRPHRMILDRLTCEVPLPKGGFTVIAGPSGCGKSTLLMLLLGLYRPVARSSDSDSEISLQLDAVSSGGHQEADQISLLDASTRFLRTSVFGFVPQTVPLFNGTVYQNLLLKQRGVHHTTTGSTCSPTPSTAALVSHVHWACTVAGCHDFISQLPEGYNTKLGDAAANLSGGQKQRLGIARALCASLGCGGGAGIPKVLLMDEPTASLDQETKRQLLDELTQLTSDTSFASGHGIKVVMVTHDPEVIARATHVVSL